MIPVLSMIALVAWFAVDFLSDAWDALFNAPSTMQESVHDTNVCAVQGQKRLALPVLLCTTQSNTRAIVRSRKTVTLFPTFSLPSWWSKMPHGVGTLGALVWMFALSSTGCSVVEDMQGTYREFDTEVRSWSPDATSTGHAKRMTTLEKAKVVLGKAFYKTWFDAKNHT